MSKHASTAEKTAVSSGTIVAAPDGSEWVVIDSCNLSDALPTEEFCWLGSVSGDESRSERFETVEAWEVVN